MPETPNRKVTAGGLAGALTIVAVFLLGDVPDHVAVALCTILTFGVSYVVRD